MLWVIRLINTLPHSHPPRSAGPKTPSAVCHQECHLFLSGITILFTWWHFLANTLEHTQKPMGHTHRNTVIQNAHTHKHPYTQECILYVYTYIQRNPAWQKCAQNWTARFMHAHTHTHTHIRSDEWIPGDRLHMHSGVRFYMEKLINNDNGVSGSLLPARCSTCCNLPCMITPESWGRLAPPS